MRRVAALLGTAAMVLTTVSVLAQEKPNFSGTWTLVPAEGAAAGGGRGGRGGRGGLGQTFTATQDASTLKIERSMGGNTMTLTYNLDGTESKNRMARGRGGEMEQVSKASWDGDKLVITTGDRKQVFSLQGGNLVVETTAPPGRGGGEPVTRTATYTKG